MTAQCIPARIQILTAIGTGATWAAVLTAAPITMTVAIPLATAALVITVRPRRKQSQTLITRPADDWTNNIRNKPARLRGGGAAKLVTLPIATMEVSGGRIDHDL